MIIKSCDARFYVRIKEYVQAKKNHAMEIHVVENHVRRGIAIGI